MVRRLALKTGVLLLSLAFALTLSEGLLRACGFQPWSYRTTDINEPTMHEPEGVLGWQNKTGSYTVPPYHPSGQTVHLTFLENGRRRTAENSPAHPAGELVLVGDSLTQGWAISDGETYAWKLQEKFPFLRVLNYGTGGYGSYQSLLMLERELPRLASPKFVLYGFYESHEMRNAAPASWLAALSRYSRRGQIDVPFATFDPEKGLLRHPPEHYGAWPFRESSALVTFVEKFYKDFKTRKRLLDKRLVTEQLLLSMNRVSEKYNATFVTVILHANEEVKAHYVHFLGENNIQVIDCAFNFKTDEMRVPGEGHPNGKMNTLWAQCISEALADQFENSRQSNDGTHPTPRHAASHES